jgi:hypothetical protein
MYRCITGSMYTMSAGLYIQSSYQDELTGKIVRSWDKDGTIRCLVVAIKEVGAASKADAKRFEDGGVYKEILDIRMHTPIPLSKRWRISDIKDSSGDYPYLEMELNGSPPTIFEVYGSHPMFDVIGRVQYYDNFLRRVAVQDND